ncbi:hypothetical protein L9F63_024851, partial [Diploptera punctata]
QISALTRISSYDLQLYVVTLFRSQILVTCLVLYQFGINQPVNHATSFNMRLYFNAVVSMEAFFVCQYVIRCTILSYIPSIDSVFNITLAMSISFQADRELKHRASRLMKESSESFPITIMSIFTITLCFNNLRVGTFGAFL